MLGPFYVFLYDVITMHEKIIRKTVIAVFSALLIIFVTIIGYPLLTGKTWVSSEDIFIFEGVSGPGTDSQVKPGRPADWRDYDQGDASRLAILLTDEDSAWLGLVHGLKTIGVPFRLTTDVDEALRHKLVLVYPVVSGKVLQVDDIKKLANYARDGGNLIGVNVLGAGLQSVFGFATVKKKERGQSTVSSNIRNNCDLTPFII